MSRTHETALGPLERLLESPLVAALASPHHVDHYLEAIDPTWSIRECRARILSITHETPDVATILLAPNARYAGHRAGQWIPVTVTVDGVRHTRTFSIASAPSEERLLRITVKANPKGKVSKHLVHDARPGELVVLGEPQGDFVLPNPAPRKVLLVSGGSGITPCMSILRDILSRELRVDVVFLHFARTYVDVPFREELAAIDGRETNVRVVLSLTRETPRGADASGRFSPEVIARLVPDAAEREIYVCGPGTLIDDVTKRFAAHVEHGRLHSERFTAPLLADDVGPADDSPKRLAFTKSAVLAKGDAKRSLLVQAEEAGLSPEYGCRMGICHSCRCGKTRGIVRDLVSGELLDETVTEIRLCVSAPVTDVTLDL